MTHLTLLAEGKSFDIVPLLLMVAPVIFVFWILSRPQRKREQERKAMVAQIKKGDRVVSIGGIYGEVVRLNEREIVLRVDKSKDVELRIMRTAISGVVGDKGEGEKGSEGIDRR